MARVALEKQRLLPLCFVVDPKRRNKAEEPLRYEAMTGLRTEQLTDLVTRVHAALDGEFVSRGRPYALGLFGSVALVVCLLRTNITQAFARRDLRCQPVHGQPTMGPAAPGDREGPRPPLYPAPTSAPGAAEPSPSS
jgi:hypothetical protein